MSGKPNKFVDLGTRVLSAIVMIAISVAAGMQTHRSCVELFRFVSRCSTYCGFNASQETTCDRVYTLG